MAKEKGILLFLLRSARSCWSGSNRFVGKREVTKHTNDHKNVESTKPFPPSPKDNDEVGKSHPEILSFSSLTRSQDWKQEETFAFDCLTWGQPPCLLLEVCNYWASLFPNSSSLNAGNARIPCWSSKHRWQLCHLFCHCCWNLAWQEATVILSRQRGVDEIMGLFTMWFGHLGI